MDVAANKLDSDADGKQAVAVSVMETERLVLRPLIAADAPAVAALAGRREIADTTISIPHPCSEERAVEWIAIHTVRSGGKAVVFAITLKQCGSLIGSMGLRDIDTEHSQAEMGFWIGLDWWGQGYATEAGRTVLRFAFEHLNLNRVHAHHMVRNPASGRVLERIGMRREGVLRQRVRKWGVFEDVVVMAILREDWIR
jgi:[ribosomal protein S5]-alanine N-acetyltransferase